MMAAADGDYRQHIRSLRRTLRRELAPPPPAAFRRFGRSLIVPPARVVNPQWIEIGDDVLIHEQCWFSVVGAVEGVTPRLVIGDRVRIGFGCQFSCVGEIIVEEDAMLGDGVLVADTYHNYEDVTRPIGAQGMAQPRTTRIGRGSLLATGAQVLRGVTVGAGAYVDASSVVTRDVAPHTHVAGNPAREEA
jgi:acetyltransferase-like isoleucine patch superfamily enzyme